MHVGNRRVDVAIDLHSIFPYLFCVQQNKETEYTLKNKVALKGSSSDAIEEKEPFSQMFFKEPSLSYFLLIWRTFFHHKAFVKQKGSSDVKGSLWVTI